MSTDHTCSLISLWTMVSYVMESFRWLIDLFDLVYRSSSQKNSLSFVRCESSSGFNKPKPEGSIAITHRGSSFKTNVFEQARSVAGDSSSYDDTRAKTRSHVAEDKIGVLLLNLGGPETLNDVQPFLYNLFADPVRISQLPSFLALKFCL